MPNPIEPQISEANKVLELNIGCSTAILTPSISLGERIDGYKSMSVRAQEKPVVTVPGFIRIQSDGVLLSIKLQPRASANEIAEPLGEELREKVTAPPVDSAANEALIRLLAERLNCPRSRIELLRGATSRHKVVKLHGVTAENVVAKLKSAIKKPYVGRGGS